MGSLVTYYFGGMPFTGIVLATVRHRVLASRVEPHFSVELLLDSGRVSAFDVYDSDRLEVHRAAG